MKILLIEDKKSRQQGFMKPLGIDLSDVQYKNILDNAIDQRYDEIYEQLKSNSLNFEDYSIIIAHKSAFEDNNEEIISRLRKYSKVLILFSGGVDANYYEKNDTTEVLELNSKVFYSNNLKRFLENLKDETNILSLCYGDKWKLNIALNIIEDINYELNETDDNKIDCEDLIDSSSKEVLDEIDTELYNKINNDIDRDNLITARNKILLYVDERLLYE